MDRLINWLEIPVVELARAKRFYGAVLGVDFVQLTMPGAEYALFPARDARNTGALVKGDGYVPSRQGPVAYLDATGRIDELLARVVQAGGQVSMPVTRWSEEAGDVAFFIDPEGNRIGLQSPVPRAPAPITDEELQRLLASAPRRFAFVFTPGPKHGPETLALQWEHARNLFQLLRAGTLHSVTALMDGTSVLGVGVMEAPSKDAVAAVLDADPAVKGGRLRYEVYAAGAFLPSDL